MAAPIKLGVRRAVVAVTPTIMIIGADTNLASTAAVPSTKAPTMLVACPIELGTLAPASLNPSKLINSMVSSRTLGKGTPCLDAYMLINNGLGINP